MSVVNVIQTSRVWSTRARTLFGVVLLGVFARVYVYSDVAVNGDTGLYLYDAKQLLWGKTIFVDFPSRSPVFEYALAAVVWLGESPIHSARVFMIAVSLALGLTIYVFTRDLYSHNTGLVAMLLFYVTPFSVTWGTWVKTEQVAAVFALTAFIIALRVIDHDTPPVRAVAATGFLLGLAFLTRRVVIVHAIAFTIFVIWYRHRANTHTVTGTITSGVLVAATGLLTLAATYAILAAGNLDVAVSIARQHAIALFTSDGMGGLGYVPLTEPQPVSAADPKNIFEALCQKCGVGTSIVFQRTILATLPTTIALVAVLRSYFDTSEHELFSDAVLPGVIISEIMLGFWVLGGKIISLRGLGLLVFLIGVAYLWLTTAPDWRDVWTPKLMLPILILLGLSAGYLYRDRVLFMSYFQDFYPYIVIISAVVIVAHYKANTREHTYHHSRNALLAGLAILVISSGVAGAHAYPYQPGGVKTDSHWFTIELVEAYGEDVEARTEPGDRVFTGQPLYVIESDRRITQDLSRKYYLFRMWSHTNLKDELGRDVARELEERETTLAVIDREGRVVLDDEHVNRAFNANYCPSDVNHELYEATGGSVWYRSDSAPTCGGS